MRPESFDTELIAGWGESVLEHGLPELPEVVARGESVPVACWAGPVVGAVHYVRHSEDDDEEHAGAGARVDTVTLCFGRTASGWEPGVGQGGSGPADPRLTRLAVPGDHVAFVGGFGTGGDGWACTTVEVLVGDRAAWIELTDTETTIRRPVDAPIGQVIVCFPTDKGPATIRILDSDETEIGRHIAW
jgi:hypothetical protein